MSISWRWIFVLVLVIALIAAGATLLLARDRGDYGDCVSTESGVVCG